MSLLFAFGLALVAVFQERLGGVLFVRVSKARVVTAIAFVVFLLTVDFAMHPGPLQSLGIAFALLSAWTDTVERRVYFWPALTAFVIALALASMSGVPVDHFGAAVVYGSVGALIASIWRSGFGYGDAVWMAVCGAVLGMSGSLYAVDGAFVLASVFGGVGILLKLANRRTAFPFAAFGAPALIAVSLFGPILGVGVRS